MSWRWLLVSVLLALSFAYGTITANQRIVAAQQEADRVLAQQVRERAALRFLALCDGSNAGRREVNRLGRALDTYLATARRLNRTAERLHPTPKILRPLLRQELKAVALLQHSVHPVKLTSCRSPAR